jgi:hypothetical protein
MDYEYSCCHYSSGTCYGGDELTDSAYTGDKAQVLPVFSLHTKCSNEESVGGSIPDYLCLKKCLELGSECCHSYGISCYAGKSTVQSYTYPELDKGVQLKDCEIVYENTHVTSYSQTEYLDLELVASEGYDVSCSIKDSCSDDEECVIGMTDWEGGANEHAVSCDNNPAKSVCCSLIKLPAP